MPDSSFFCNCLRIVKKKAHHNKCDIRLFNRKPWFAVQRWKSDILYTHHHDRQQCMGLVLQVRTALCTHKPSYIINDFSKNLSEGLWFPLKVTYGTHSFSPPTSFFTNSMQKFERALFYQTQGWSKKDNPPATLWTSLLVFMKKAPIKIASCSYNCTFWSYYTTINILQTRFNK